MSSICNEFDEFNFEASPKSRFESKCSYVQFGGLHYSHTELSMHCSLGP